MSIVDASNLDRNLYLTTQALELGVPVVVALNMVDVAEGQGIRIDADRLGRQLGVPVVPIQANKGKGLDELRGAIAGAVHRPQDAQGRRRFPEAFEREVKRFTKSSAADVPDFLVRRLLLDVGGYTEKRLVDRLGADVAERVQRGRARLASAGCPVPAVEARTRYAWIREATAGCVQRPAKRARHLDRPHRPGADAQGLGHAGLPGGDVRRLPVDLHRRQAAHERHRRRQGLAGRTGCAA